MRSVKAKHYRLTSNFRCIQRLLAGSLIDTEVNFLLRRLLFFLGRDVDNVILLDHDLGLLGGLDDGNGLGDFLGGLHPGPAPPLEALALRASGQPDDVGGQRESGGSDVGVTVNAGETPGHPG